MTSKQNYLVILSILIAGLLPRTLHLLNDNYFILGADSYLFHYLSRSTDPAIAVNGYPLHSGLAYPVRWLSVITGDYLAVCIVPLILYAVTALLLYWYALRHFGRIAAVAALIAWSLMPQPSIITSAGYMDRDGLSVLLVAAAMVTTTQISMTSGTKRIMWIAGLIVLAVAQWAQWVLTGAVILVAISGLILMAQRLHPYNHGHKITIVAMLLVITSVIPSAILMDGHLYRMDSSGAIGEMSGLQLADLFLCWGWAAPFVLIGWAVTIWSRRVEGVSVVLWFGIAMAGAIMVSRMMVLALPAACILAGLSIDYGLRKYQEEAGGWSILKFPLARAAAGVIIITVVVTSIWSTWGLQTNQRMAASADWQDALGYLADNTPDGSRIACLGDYGYQVLDIAGRIPAADGGPRHKLRDISSLYCARTVESYTDTMEALGCDYFICGRVDYESDGTFKKLAREAHPDDTYEFTKDESVIWGWITSGSGPAVYRNETVMIYKSEPSAEQAAGSVE